MALQEVTDPELIRLLNGEAAPPAGAEPSDSFRPRNRAQTTGAQAGASALQEVTDPDLLRQLNTTPATDEQGADITPVARPPQPQPVLSGDQGPSLVLDLPKPVPDIVLQAADAGVLYDKPAPAGHFLQSLAINGQERVKAYALSLKQQMGRDVPVRVGPKTGAVEFLDKDTNRWSLALPPGSGIEQIEAFGGPAIIAVPELVAGVTAGLAAAGTGPAAIGISIGVGSGGAFVGEVTRLALGQSLGINQDATIEDIAKEGLKEAGISLAFGVGTVAAVRLAKLIVDLVQGRIVTREIAEAAGMNVQEAADLAEKINERTGAQKMSFTLAQATNDEDLLATQELLKKSPEFRRVFGAFERDQQAALQKYYDEINKPYQSRLSEQKFGGSTAKVTEAVKGVGEQKVQQDTLRANTLVQRAEAELEDVVGSLQVRPLERLGVDYRPFGDAELEAFRAKSRADAANLNDVAGSAEFIPNVETWKTLRTLKEEQRRFLFQNLGRGFNKIAGEATEAANPRAISPGAAQSIGLPTDENIARKARKAFDKDAKFTFLEAWDTISELKRLRRTVGRGGIEEPDVATIDRVVKALEGDLRAGAEGSDLRPLYDQFITAYRRGKTRLDAGTAGKIMEQRAGRYVVSDQKVFDEVFKVGDARPSQEFRAVIENNPEQMQGMRESILDLYRRKTIDPETGRVKIGAHNQFMSDYQTSLPEYFTKQEMGVLRRTRNAEKVLVAREEAQALALKRINASVNADLANLKPGGLASLVMDTKHPGKAGVVMAALENTPDIARAVRSEVRKDMAERVMGQFEGGQRILNFKKFQDYLIGKTGVKGHAQNLREVFGNEYVDNLHTLNQALKVASRETAHPNRSNTTFWNKTIVNISRAYVGLFTRPGRFLTAANQMRGRAANAVLVRAMLNPDNLAELMRVKGLSLKSTAASEVIGRMGGSVLLEDYDPEALDRLPQEQ